MLEAPVQGIFGQELALDPVFTLRNPARNLECKKWDELDQVPDAKSARGPNL